MACEIELHFGDTDTATISGAGTSANPFVVDVVVETCAIAGGDGLTGTMFGAAIMGCQVPDLNELDPDEAGFAPADFPERWHQHFVNGRTGSELWVVLADHNGARQWHQIA